MLEKIKSTFDRGLATVSVKSESMVEISRIKAQIQGLQKQQTTMISRLGEEMYAMWKSNEMDRERFEQLCGEISGVEKTVEELNRRIEQVRTEEQQLLGTSAPAAGAAPAAAPAQGLFCPACGTKNQPGARFCVNCGGKLGE